MECNLDKTATCLYCATSQLASHCRTAPRETPLGCQVQLVGLLDRLLIALVGIPSTLQYPMHCSIAAHSYVCNHLGLTSPSSHTPYVLHIAATSLMQSQIFGPMVTALDRFHCNSYPVAQNMHAMTTGSSF